MDVPAGGEEKKVVLRTGHLDLGQQVSSLQSRHGIGCAPRESAHQATHKDPRSGVFARPVLTPDDLRSTFPSQDVEAGRKGLGAIVSGEGNQDRLSGRDGFVPGQPQLLCQQLRATLEGGALGACAPETQGDGDATGKQKQHNQSFDQSKTRARTTQATSYGILDFGGPRQATCCYGFCGGVK